MTFASGRKAQLPVQRWGEADVAMEVEMSIAYLPHPVGYVLGGGGSLGAVQVGMLQALAERDVLPDVVAGTSVGSLNGTLVALEPKSAANRLSHLWARMTRERVFPGGLLAQARTLQHNHTHLFPSAGLAAVIADFIGAERSFADLALPFAVVTTDIATARPHVLRDGLLLPALLASTAIPGIFPPVELGPLRLYDGGLVANVPMRQAVAMGARSLVVLDCNFPGNIPEVSGSMAEVLFYTVMVTMRTQAILEAPLVASELPVVYLHGPEPFRISPLDFRHTGTLIETAYEAARAFLDELDITGPGLYGSP
jgi:NTE family protein